VDVAVRTAIGRHSEKYSVAGIKPHHTLKELGLDQKRIAGVRTSVYRMFEGKHPRPALAQYLRRSGAALTAGSTVRDTVKHLYRALEDPTKLP